MLTKWLKYGIIILQTHVYVNYTYDANGNITQITDASGTIQNKYYYDDLGQLTREDNRALGKTYVYTYDNAGNRLSKKTYAFTTGTLGSVQSTESYTYASDSEYGNGMGDWLMYMNGYELSYDNAGNPTEYVIKGYRTQLDWEGRLLTGMNELDSAEFEYYYMYNDEGIRTSKWVDGVTYYYTLNGSQYNLFNFEGTRYEYYS